MDEAGGFGPALKCEPAGLPRQKDPAPISSSFHLSQRCSALVLDGQTSSTEATKRLRRRRKLQQSLALRRQSSFQTRGKERLRRHSLQPPSLASDKATGVFASKTRPWHDRRCPAGLTHQKLHATEPGLKANGG